MELSDESSLLIITIPSPEEFLQEESLKEESSQEEPVQEESLKEESSQEEPVQEESLKEESVQDKSVQDKSVQDKLVQDKPVQDKPIQDEPVQDEPIQEEPIKEESVQDETIQEEPIKEESVQDEPVQDEPVQEDSSLKDEPVQEESSKDKPIQEEPVQEESVQEESIQDEPVQEESVQEESVQDEPVQDEPVQEESVQDEPVQDEPVQDEPVQEESVQENIVHINNWIVLLTTCLNPQNQFHNNRYEIRFRKDLYTHQLRRWLNETNLRIVVVESSGYTFPDVQHERLTVISFTFDKKYDSSSQYEARSLMYTMDKIKNMDFFGPCTHILKVTGRYFLKNVENVLSNAEQNLDLYLQYWRHDGREWQNTEYFGIRKELLLQMLEPIIDIGLIENCLFHYSLTKKYCFIGKFPNNIPRGGDKKLYTEL